MSSLTATPAALLWLANACQDALAAQGVTKLLLQCEDTGLDVSCHYHGQRLKCRLVLATDLGALTVDVQHVLVDGLPVKASWVEHRIAPFVPAHYYGGMFHWTLPGLTFTQAGVSAQGLFCKVE